MFLLLAVAPLCALAGPMIEPTPDAVAGGYHAALRMAAFVLVAFTPFAIWIVGSYLRANWRARNAAAHDRELPR
jgi:hypothetical protein